MAILKIARMGHPVLLARAAEVPDPAAPEMGRLLADMAETLEDAGGVGLAAPQVHEALRLFIYKVPASRAAGADGGDQPSGDAARRRDGNGLGGVPVDPRAAGGGAAV